MGTEMDRRKHERVTTPRKLAICYSPTQESLYNVFDLSVEGAQLGRGPLLDVGTPIRLEILDGPLSPLRLQGRIVRAGRRSMGISFADDQFRRVGRIHSMLERARLRAQPEIY